jgi:hypothetical protein
MLATGLQQFKNLVLCLRDSDSQGLFTQRCESVTLIRG